MCMTLFLYTSLFISISSISIHIKSTIPDLVIKTTYKPAIVTVMNTVPAKERVKPPTSGFKRGAGPILKTSIITMIAAITYKIPCATPFDL